MFDFRFNTPTLFPESGSRKRFHASEMRAIDSPHKITYMLMELVSFEPFLVRFLSLNKKGRFFLMFLRTFHALFLGYFFIGKSVFDAVFCHYRAFNSTDFDSKTNLGSFPYETIEF